MINGMRVLLILALLLLASCDSFAQGCKQGFEKGFGEEFTKSFTKEFDTSCTDTAVKQGGVREKAAACCGCISRTLLADNGPIAVGKASMNPKGTDFQTMLFAAMAKCDTCPKPAAPAAPPKK